MSEKGKRVLVSGGTGLVGEAVVGELRKQGWETVLLSRSGGDGRIEWSPLEGKLDGDALERFDAVVHLAGEPLMGRWTEDKKRRIRESRARGTRLLCETLAVCRDKPRVLVSASGLNYYGKQPQEELTEQSPKGDGFLADVAHEWEAATEPAAQAGVRTVLLRIAMVLSGEGGALEKLLPVFRSGAGGPVGSGRQMVSWVQRDDLARIICFAIENDGLSGPVNACAPEAVPNKRFSEAIGAALHRPAVLRVPKFAVRAVYGEVAEETVFASHNAVPQKLLANGFSFTYPDIESAVEYSVRES